MENEVTTKKKRFSLFKKAKYYDVKCVFKQTCTEGHVLTMSSALQREEV